MDKRKNRIKQNFEFSFQSSKDLSSILKELDKKYKEYKFQNTNNSIEEKLEKDNIEETKDIEEKNDLIKSFYNKFLKHLNKDNVFAENINILFNAKFEEQKNLTQVFEIDGIVIFENDYSLVIILLETKNYFENSNDYFSYDALLNVFKKSKKFYDYFFSCDKNINLYLYFSFFDNSNENIVEVFRINEFFKIKNSVFRHLPKHIYVESLCEFIQKNNFFSKSKIKEFLINNLLNSKNEEFLLECFERNISILDDDRYSNILNCIKSQRVTFFKGEAGTGKTSLAFTIFGCLEKSKFIIINDKFLSSLKEQYKYKEILKRIIDIKEINNLNLEINERSYLLIDECQRLSNKNISTLRKMFLNYHKLHLIFFGDSFQQINLKRDVGISDFKNWYIKEHPDKTKFEYKLETNYRFNKDDINKIKYSLCLTNTIIEADKNQTFECSSNNIEIEENIINFKSKILNFNKFKEKKLEKYGVFTIQYAEYSRDKKFNFPNSKLKDRHLFLKNENYLKEYCFYPYDIISKEIDVCFLYIPDFIKLNQNKEIFMDTNLIEISNIKYITRKLELEKEIEEFAKSDFFKKQIYVLATRWTKKIIIFVENNEYRNEIKKRLEELKIINRK